MAMASERTRKKQKAKIEAEDNPFMVKDQKRKEVKDERAGMKTSDAINIYDVGDAPVIDYIKNEKKKEMEYSKDSDVIEFSADKIEYMDLTDVKVVEIDGVSERADLKKKTKADFKSLKGVKLDPKKSFKDIERNIDEYKPLCQVCRASMECKTCGGKGKKGLFFKCSACDGTGMCMECGELSDVKCPSCQKVISVFSTSCKYCGAAFNCPKCYNPLPTTATRCIKCRTQFTCQRCRNVVSPGMDKKCPKCGTTDWFGKTNEELPLRNLSSENK